MTTLEQLFGGRTAAIVPEVIGPSLAARARDSLEHAGYRRYALYDRGSYDVLADPEDPALFGALVEIAAHTTGRLLALAEARALRLGPGDYLLAHHDRIHDDHPVELVLLRGSTATPRQLGAVLLRQHAAIYRP